MSATELQLTSLVNMMIQLYKRRSDPRLKEQYDLQKSRYVDMSNGGDGGKAGLYGRRPTDSPMSTHESSIRELHHANWSDDDFKEFLKRLDKATDAVDHESPEDSAKKHVMSPEDEVKRAVVAVCSVLRPFRHNDRADILNTVAEELGMYEPED